MTEHKQDSPKEITAALIIIGNEILSGRTQDKNANYIAVKLTEKGIRFREIRVIPDISQTIIDTVREFSGKFDYVFTTGGIGPTHDDITAENVAAAFDTPLEQNKEAYQILLDHYGPEDLTEARLKMAQIPVGADLIPNPVSAAPGFKIGNVYVMAGVPKIMQAMFDYVLDDMQGGVKMLCNTIACKIPESRLAPDLDMLQNQYPGVEIGSYPNFKNGDFGVSVVLRSTEPEPLKEASAKVVTIIEGQGGEPTTLGLDVEF